MNRLEMYKEQAKIAGVFWIMEMSWTAMNELDRSKTLILHTLGPVEQHGPHNPLGLDIYVAEAMTYRLAAEIKTRFAGWNVIIGPTIPYCMAVLSRNYPGSTSLRRNVVRDLIQDITGSYAANGFLQQIITSHHIEPGNMVAVDEGCALTNARYKSRIIHGFNHLIMDSLESKEFQKPFIRWGMTEEELAHELHAGAIETSEMLYLNAQWVDVKTMEALPACLVPLNEVLRVKSFKEVGNGLGYQGNVKKASQPIGEASFEQCFADFVSLVVRHLQGEDQTEVFRGKPWQNPKNHSKDYQQLLAEALNASN